MSVTVRTIIDALDEIYPRSLAMEWDNPGLQVGRTGREVTRAVVALDATDEVVARCVSENAQLLLTHHPLTMGGVRQVHEDDMTGRRILLMAENGIAHFAMHTNYDVVTMGPLAGRMLGLEQDRVLDVTAETEGGTFGIGRAGLLPAWCTAQECCEQVKKTFELDGIRLFGDPERKVRYVAISPGSGKSMIRPALALGVDMLIPLSGHGSAGERREAPLCDSVKA